MADLAGFFQSWEPQPTYVPAPGDAALAQRIQKLAQFAGRNGPGFVDLMRTKQQNNPEYAFLSGGEGGDYWRWILYCTLLGQDPEQPGTSGPPPEPYQTYLPQTEAQQYGVPPPAPYGGGLPPDMDSAFTKLLDELTGSKDSIRAGKDWFMKAGPQFAGLLAARIAAYAGMQSSYSRILHLVYLTNDILLRAAGDADAAGTPAGSDPVSLAFLPVLPGMLQAAHGKGSEEQSFSEVGNRLNSILDFWQERRVFDPATISHLKEAMRATPLSPHPPGPQPPVPNPHTQAAPPPWPSPLAPVPQPVPMASQVGPMQGFPPPQFGYGPPPDMMQPAWQGGGPPPFQGPPLMAGPPLMPNPSWPAQPHGLPGAGPPGVPMGMDMQFGGPPGQVWFPPPGAPVPPVVPHMGPPMAFPAPPGIPRPPSPPPQDVAPPSDPMSFPPGLIPKLVKEKLELEEPYHPLSTRDVEEAGLPSSHAPNAYLASRLDKFYAELQDYRAGMLRADEEEKQKRAARLTGEAPPERPREHASVFNPPTKRKGEGGRSGRGGAVGLGFSSQNQPNTEGPALEDVYRDYRSIRSNAYKDAMARAQAAAAAMMG